jgi:hypothetical protein
MRPTSSINKRADTVFFLSNFKIAEMADTNIEAAGASQAQMARVSCEENVMNLRNVSKIKKPARQEIPFILSFCSLLACGDCSCDEC